MPAAESSFALDVPVHRHRLANGLRVVVSPDHAAPIVCVAVYYHVGMRIEPKGRTGFAHLFEHLMFQGSANLGKMELVQQVQQNGGTLNGSTRYDYTNYFEVMPAHTLELALWMEADRMRGPVITQAELDNQRDVVKNEIRVNVLNRPYGSFPWIDMNERAFENWHNSHNGYGDMRDLDAASLEDVKAFFDAYYSPANAVLVLVGDVEPEEGFRLVEQHFADIPSSEPPAPPDLSEPRQEEERRFSRTDPLATRPALAVSYHTPSRGAPGGDEAYYALGLLDQVLLQGEDSLLHQELVTGRGYTGDVSGGINFLGNMHNAQTPLLWTSALFHDSNVEVDQILGAYDQVLAPVLDRPLDAAAFERGIVKARSALYRTLTDGTYPGVGRVDLLASFELFEGDASHINDIERRFRDLTPETVQQAAQDYLRPTNRNVLSIEPGATS
jgi:zinc protease